MTFPQAVRRGAYALVACLAAHPRAALGQTPYKIAEGHLRIESIAAQAQPAAPVVPKNTLSAVRVSVRAGDRELTAEEVAQSFGPGFRVQAELSGPGLTQTVTLPRQGDPVLPDPLLLVLPPLSKAGSYELRGMRIAAADGHAVLDVAPQATTLRIIEQILITSVQTRPLTRDEIRDRGILLDNQAYLGFEFTLVLRLESDQVDIKYPVVFDREGLPHPPTIPIPPLPSRNVPMPPLPQIVPMMLKVPTGGNGGGGGGGGGGGDDLGGTRIPSILVIPGNVGYLKQFFSAQLLVSNGAPAGSGLSVRGITAHVKLPPGPDLVPGNADDPLALPALESGPAPATLPVKGVGPDGEPGTPDDVDVLAPAQQGQAEFLVRGDQEGFHTLDFDIAAVLEGLPVGPRNVTGTAKGGVLVRNPYFDVAFMAPSVVRKGERFKLFATLTNMGHSAANDVNVTLDASRMSGAHLSCTTPPCNGTVVVDTIRGGDARTVEFLLESERTGEVVASYMKFQPGLQGRLTFTLGVGERGVPLSPDTLVLPASLDALPVPVVDAAMRVLGQGWSIAKASHVLPGQVAPTDQETVQKKALALAEAGMRVQLGQPVAAAVRDLAFDFYGGTPLDDGFDQLLRTTEAGRDFAFALGVELAGAAGGNAPAYEQAVARIAASGPDAMTFAVRSAGDPVSASVADALGRRSEGARSLSLPLSEVPGAVFLPLGAPAAASYLGVVTAPDKAPYTFTLSGPAELSVSYPRGGTRFSRAALTTAHPARVLVDFASGDVSVDEDVDGDGDYDEHRTVAAADFAPEGARLLAANIVGPETLDGSSALGLQVALLFDRMVDAESGADKTRYQLPRNGVAAARRQLSGRLVFASLRQPEGPYLPSSVSASGIRDARGVEGPAATVPLLTRVTDIGAVVSGRVVEADGHPLAGAVVRYLNTYSCTSSELTPVSDVNTDADGRYELRYVRQNECGQPFELAVWDPVTGARRSVRLSVRTAGERIVADIALLGRGSVTGTVLDGAGAPAPGATVRVISVTDPGVGAVAQADGDGRYVVHDITVGAVNATAVKGLLVGRGAGVIAHAGGTATVDVRLEGQSARISGTVYKLENGHTSEAPGIPVLYLLRPSGVLVGYAYTDAAGRYALEGMPAGDFTLTAMLNTRDKASVLYRADPGQTIEDLDVIVEVPPDASLGTVRGIVRLPGGSPAAGVIVSVQSRGVVSAADGSYEITGLALPSNPQVTARTTDGLRTGSAYAVLTPQQPLAEGIDVTLSGVGRVEFTVLDPAGNPMVGQHVTLLGSTCAADCGCSQSTTGPDGRVGWNVPLGTWGAKAIKWTNGKADEANAVAHLTQDGFTAFGVIRMAGFGLVSGTVRDAANNNPLHGAVVVLTANKFVQTEGCHLQSIFVGTRTTDPNGNFQFLDVNAGPVSAMATHPIVTGTATASGTLAAGGTVTLALRLSSADTMAGELSGTVYEPDGTTHVGAGVQVTVNGVLPDVTVHTNADGVFRFAEVLPQGHYRMTARDPISGRVAGKSIFLRAGQDAAHDLRLLGRGTVVVKVVDGGGHAVDTAQVRLRGTEFPNRVYEGAVQPGMEGRLTLSEVVEGPYAVDASDAFGRGGRASFVLPGPDETAEVKVTLTVVGTVHGHFLMPDGAPIPFGAVRLIAGGRAVGQLTTAGSGDLGFFSFSYVPAGPLRLEALDPATGRTGLAVGALESEGQNVLLDIRAQALGTVQGVVTSNGVPEPGALVDIVSGTYRVSTAADPQGFYKVVGVPEGRPTVQASLAGGYLKATRSETLLGEGTVLTVDMALRPTGTVEGTVTEAVGSTPALAVVSVRAGGVGGGNFARPTNQSGEFEFERVAAGQASISADELGSIDQADATIDVPAGGTVQVPLRLNGVGSLRGIARASGGAPTAGWLWVHGSGPYGYTRGLNLGPNGVFAFPELMAGPFTLTLRTLSGGISLYGSATGTIAPDQETVLDVQLEPSGTVTGVVMRPGGASPAFGADVTLTHAKGTATAQAQPDGRFTFKGVPLGPITVRIHDPITTGRATVRGRTVASNQEIVDVGTLVLDNAAPTIAPVDPLEGSTRAKLSGALVVDLADDGSGIDTSSFSVRYATGTPQAAGEFTYTGGRAQGLFWGAYLAIGPNTVTLSVKDLAGNETTRPLTFTVTGATVTGTVRWADGTPAAGIQVQVGQAPAVTTGADGRYVRTGVRSASYVIATDPASGITKWTYMQVYDGEDAVVNVTMPAYGWIRGTVRRANGTGAPGVNVAGGFRTVTTAADGSFNLGAFVLGSYFVTATNPANDDRAQTTIVLETPGQTVQKTLTLNGIGRVIVNVRDASGAVVPGALVNLTSSSPLSNGYQLTANGAGTADFPKVLAGGITAIARDIPRGLAGASGDVLTDAGTLTLNVTLSGAGTVTGTVRQSGGAPAPDVNVSIGPLNTSTTTGADGVFTFPSVPLGQFQLQATAPGGDFATGSGTVQTQGQTVTVDLTLNGTGTVIVEVRDSFGAPAPDVNLKVSSSANTGLVATGVSGPDGRATFAGVLAGQITAKATIPATLQRGEASATLATGATLGLTVPLESVGTIRGRVLQPDGVTPAEGVDVRTELYGSGAYSYPLAVLSGANGVYELRNIPLHTYTVEARLGGRLRARQAGLELTANGQVLEQDLVLAGVGTVTGLVTDPQGAPVGAGVPVNLASSAYPYGGSFATTTGTDGRYSIAGVAVGDFTISAERFALGQRVDSSGTVAVHGQTVVMDLQLLASVVSLPFRLDDGNARYWFVREDGATYGGWYVIGSDPALQLSLVVGETTHTFAGSGPSGASEEAQRETVIRQTLGGVNVTRKAFVPPTGYFIRLLDVFENPSDASLTVDAVYNSTLGDQNRIPSVVDSSSGDATVTPADRWVMIDDADTDDIYDSTAKEIAPLGIAVFGTGGVAPSSTALEGRELTQRWQLTIPAHGRVGLLQLITPQADRARGRASAERLDELPPEALAGLTPEEGAAVANFAVPPDLVSAMAPLPLNDGVVSGQVWAGDGATPLRAWAVFRSRSPHYGRPFGVWATDDGAYAIHSQLAGAVNVVPRVPFDMKSSVTTQFGVVTGTGSGDFATEGVRDLAGLAGTTLNVSSSLGACCVPGLATDRALATYWQAQSGDSTTNNHTPFFEVVLPSPATIHEVRIRGRRDAYDSVHRARVEVRDAAGTVLWSTEAVMPPPPQHRDADVLVPAVAGARAVRLVVLEDPGWASFNEVYVLGEIEDGGPSRDAAADIHFDGTATLSGRVKRADLSGAPGSSLTLSMGGHNQFDTAEAPDGDYAYLVVPSGTYSLKATSPAGDASVTIPSLALPPNQRTVQDLVLPAFGTVLGAYFSSVNQPVNGTAKLVGTGVNRETSAVTTYRFDDVPPGPYTLTLTDFRSKAPLVFTITVVAGEILQQDAMFPPVGTVDVTARLNGALFSGGGVYFKSPARGPGWNWAGWTDGAGFYRIDNVPGPGFTVKVTHPANVNSAGEASSSLTEGQVVPVNVTVPGVGSVSGVHRTRNGVAVAASAYVTAYSVSDETIYGTTNSNASGVFQIANVPVGPFRLRAFPIDSHNTMTTREEAELTATLTTHGQTLSVDALAPRDVIAVPGERHLWETTLAAGQQVKLVLFGDAIATAPALADTFLEVYAPDGSLAASNDNRSAQDLNSEVNLTAAQAGVYVVLARAAATQTGGYHLGTNNPSTLVYRTFAGATVHGTVTRQSDGAAVQGATVRLAAATAGGLSVTRSVQTGAAGQYSFTGVPVNADTTISLLDASGTVLAEAVRTTGEAGSTLDVPLVSPSLGIVEVRALQGTQPFQGLAVTVTSDNTHAASGLRVQQGATGLDGRLVVAKAPAGAIAAQATDPTTGDPLQATGSLSEGATLVLELHVAQSVDQTPPSAVTNLVATAVAAGRIRLTWTAPGDDGTAGTAAAYDVRYATAPITAANFSAATSLTAPVPAPAGTAQAIEAVGFNGGVTYYFALVTRDEAFNWSALSNVPGTSASLPAAGLKLWLRADAGVTTDAGTENVNTWADQSGNGNHATQSVATSRPLRVAGEANGLPVLRFDGSSDGVNFTTRITNVRTVIWVIRENASASGYRYLLSDPTGTPTGYPYSSGQQKQIWSPGFTDIRVKGGETRVNGALVDGTTTNRPSALSVITLVTTADLGASGFSKDSGFRWLGDIAELIIYDRPLNDDERRQVEDYLARRYALYTPTTPRSAPAISPNGGRFAEAVTVTLSGSALMRYTLDGNDPSTSSEVYAVPLVLTPPVTVKARGYAPDGTDPSPVSTATFLHANLFNPATLAGLKLWVRADAGVSGEENVRVWAWADQSGLGNALVQSGPHAQPVLVPNGAGTLPALRFDGSNDLMDFTTQLTTIRTVFWVVKETAGIPGQVRSLLGDGNAGHFWGGGSHQIWSTNASNFIKLGETRVNGEPKDGLTTLRPTAMSVISLKTTGNVTASAFSKTTGNPWYWHGDLAELIVYDVELSLSDRRAVEQYLAARYGITVVP